MVVVVVGGGGGGKDSSLQSSSVQVRWHLCARKSPLRCALYHVSKRSPNVAFQAALMSACLTVALSRHSKEDRLALNSSFHSSLLQTVAGVTSLAFCPPQLVSQAPQHLRSSETQTTCGSCFSRQSNCSDISLHSGMSRAVHPLEFSDERSTLNTKFEVSYVLGF